MTLDEYRERYAVSDESAPGWDALDRTLDDLHGDQKPFHWGTSLPMLLGGSDPIDGFRAYPCWDGGVPHVHFCSYGFSSLYYDEKSVGREFSRFGFELTFRLRKEGRAAQEEAWVCSLIQHLARHVFLYGKWFEANQWIATKTPIKVGSDTTLVGIAFTADPGMSAIETPHGRVEFLQMFGITQREMDRLGHSDELTKILLDKHRLTNPMLITDLDRGELN